MAAEKRFEQLLRPPYEVRAAVGWAIAAFWMLLCAVLMAAPKMTLLVASGFCVLMAAMRMAQGHHLLLYKLWLSGVPVRIMGVTEMFNVMHKFEQNLWLGWGYKWEPRHTQRAYEIGKKDEDDLYPSRFWLKVLRHPIDPRATKGKPWIHGLDMSEGDVLLPFDSLKGHCAIIATTGAIKTVLARLIITQLAARGDTVIVVDPKGDKDLLSICREAAIYAGDPKRFLMLHPAFASKSVRIDLVKNWDQVSQVASRITMVLDGEEDDNFKAFCWKAVHQITSGMKYIGRRVSLYGLKNAMENRISVERLTEEVLRKFFAEDAPQLLELVEKTVNSKNAAGGSKGKSEIEFSTPEIGALIKVFQLNVPETKQEAEQKGLPVKPDEIRGLISILESPRDWFGKMIVSITPLLTKLTTDDLRGLLSPDYEDITDIRPIMDGKRIVEGNHILYVGTDTLSDEKVGHSLATMLSAELSAVAAEIYNHGLENDEGKEKRRIHLVFDEWGDAVSSPVLQQANKGRGAGFFIWAMGQTYADLVDKFGGNTSRAKRFMGNMNNLIVGATQDPDTMDLIVSKLGETDITVRSLSTGIGSKTEDIGLEFSANQSQSVSEQTREIFPRSLLPTLPDMHYIGFFNRGELIKGRIPVIINDKKA